MSGSIQVERVGKRIHLRGWIGPDTPKKCKSIPGATFSKHNGPHWSYPLDMQVCHQLREQFGDALEIGPELWEWASTERRTFDRQRKLASATDAKLSYVSLAPKLAEALGHRKFQRVGAAFLSNTSGAILADEPGLGKTVETLGAIIERNHPGAYLILCKKTAVTAVWAKNIERWLDGVKYNMTLAIGSRAEREAAIEGFWSTYDQYPQDYHFLICNVEMMQARKYYRCDHIFEGKHALKSKKCTYRHSAKDIFVQDEYPQITQHLADGFDGIVIDESHKWLVHTGGEMTASRMGIASIPENAGCFRYALSGTPYRGKTKNIWGTLNWCRPDLYTSYWRWAEQHLEVETVQHNAAGSTHKTVGELRDDARDAFYRSLTPVMLRRTKAEVAPEMPPKQIIPVMLHMDGKQAQAYKAITLDAEAKLDSGLLTTAGILSELTRLRQFASSYGEMIVTGQDDLGLDITDFHPAFPSNKYDWLCEFLDERGFYDGSGAGKVVVASQSTQLINMFADKFEKKGIANYRLTGETSAKRRDIIQDEFQNNKTDTRLFFLNTDAGGDSIDLDAADEMVFLDEKWNPDDQEQAENRIHRISRIHKVSIYYLRTIGTIDETVSVISGDRRMILEEHLDTRRGVQVARQLIRGGIKQ